MVAADNPAFSTGLGQYDLHAPVVDVVVNCSGRIAAAADTGYQVVRIVAAFLLLQLFADLLADNRLQPGHHIGVRVRADRRADDVVRVGRVAAPVADCLVRGVLQRHVARSDRAHFGAQHFHFLHIRVLTFYVGLAHVDDAPHVFQRADRSGSHTVLPCARFGDDTGFAHLLRDQNLSDRIVDLVRSGMVQVFAFEVDPAAVPFGQAPCEIERGRAADIVAQQLIEFAAERFRLHNG